MKSYKKNEVLPKISSKEIMREYEKHIESKKIEFKKNNCNWESVEVCYYNKKKNEKSRFKINFSDFTKVKDGKVHKNIFFEDNIGDVFRVYDTESKEEYCFLLCDICKKEECDGNMKNYVSIYPIGAKSNILIEYHRIDNIVQGKLLDIINLIPKKTYRAKTSSNKSQTSTSNTIKTRNPELTRVTNENVNKRLNYDNRCFITGNPIAEHAHIKDWSKCERNEHENPANIIMLEPMLHDLFDRGAWSFDTTGHIIISPKYAKLINKNFSYFLYDGAVYDIDNDDHARDEFINWHNKNVFQK